MVQIYNKAIRDKIPEIIQATGKSFSVITMADSDFLPQMEKKLSEEVDEYRQTKLPEELADILEVIYRIAELRGINKKELEKIRQTKEAKSGSFSRNLFLIETR